MENRTIAGQGRRGRAKEFRWSSLCGAMLKRKMDDDGLADALGVHRRSVQCWRLGVYHPSLIHLMAICRVLDCRPEDILADAPLLLNLPQ